MKTVFYLCNTYIATIEELQKTIEDNYLGKAGKPFRKELVALLMDGILEKWLIEHNCEEKASHLLRLKETNEASDSEVFKEVYRILLGKECTADLEAAFSSIAKLLYCEVDGAIITIQNNKIVLPETANEIKFVYQAIDEIDSKVCFELTKLKSKTKHWGVDNKMPFCSKGGEFSISFSFLTMGKKREGLYVWDFVSDHKERLFEMEIINENIWMISPNNGEQLALYCFNDGNRDFWVTEPCPIYTESPYAEVEAMLEKFNLANAPLKFNLATAKEIKTVLEQGPKKYGKVFSCSQSEITAFPYYDGKFVCFLDTNSKKRNYSYSLYFVAVLHKKNQIAIPFQKQHQ